MHLVRRNPRGYSTVDPFAGLDSILDGFLRPAHTANAAEGWHLPATDIHETRDSYAVTTELPGVKKEDIKVSLHEGVLTISAERRTTTDEKAEGTALRRERRYGQFVRRFALGPDVQDDKVEARFEDGVLTLVIPKQQPQANGPRTIEIH